jgi:hypothetical protein
MGLYSISGTFALTAATATTLLRVNTPASRKITLRRITAVDGLAAATDTGMLVRLMKGGTDGTGTAATPLPRGSAAACVSTAKVNYTAEPSGAPTEIDRWRIPAGGGLDLRFDGEEGYECVHSSALYLEFTAVQARGANIVSAELVFEE